MTTPMDGTNPGADARLLRDVLAAEDAVDPHAAPPVGECGCCDCEEELDQSARTRAATEARCPDLIHTGAQRQDAIHPHGRGTAPGGLTLDDAMARLVAEVNDPQVYVSVGCELYRHSSRNATPRAVQAEYTVHIGIGEGVMEYGSDLGLVLDAVIARWRLLRAVRGAQ